MLKVTVLDEFAGSEAKASDETHLRHEVEQIVARDA